MGEIIEIIFRVIGDLVLEVALKGPGWAIQRFVLRNKHADPDGLAALFLGILFWSLIGLCIWGLVVLL